MATLVSDTVDVESAIAAEQVAPHGLIEVRFYTTSASPPSQAQVVFDKLWSNGIDVRKVSIVQRGGLPYLSVIYNRPAPVQGRISVLPLAIIPLVAFGMIAGLVGIGIFKISDLTSNIAKLMLIAFGGTILLAVVLRKPLETAAGRR